MKKTFKTLLILCMVVALFGSVSVSASAAEEYGDGVAICGDLIDDWVTTTLTVPGRNKSVVSEVFDYKATDSKQASFCCTYKSLDKNCDARLVNSEGESRSSWARNLDINDVINVSTNAVKSYPYYCQVSSDLLTSGSATVTVGFSADRHTLYP